jgi:hypothetical protein
MRYLSTQEAADRIKISASRLRRLAAAGRVAGALRIGKVFAIPDDVVILPGNPPGNPHWRRKA